MVAISFMSTYYRVSHAQDLSFTSAETEAFLRWQKLFAFVINFLPLLLTFCLCYSISQKSLWIKGLLVSYHILQLPAPDSFESTVT